MTLKYAIYLFFVLASLVAAPHARAIDAGMPNPPSSPTEVSVGVFVADIIDLDEVNENFQLELILMATWHDPRLAFDAEKRERTKRFFRVLINLPKSTRVGGPSCLFSMKSGGATTTR